MHQQQFIFSLLGAGAQEGSSYLLNSATGGLQSVTLGMVKILGWQESPLGSELHSLKTL